MSSPAIRLAMTVSVVCMAGVYGPILDKEKLKLDQLAETLKLAAKEEDLPHHPELVKLYNKDVKAIIRDTQILMSTEFLGKLASPAFVKDVISSTVNGVISPGLASIADPMVKANAAKRADGYVDQAVGFLKNLASKFKLKPTDVNVEDSDGPISVVLQP